MTIPPVPEMTPAKVVDVELPVVSVAEPRVIAPVPEAATDATVSDTPFKSNVAPSLTTTAVESESWPPVANFRVPSVIAVVPTYVCEPLIVSVPEPPFDSPA